MGVKNSSRGAKVGPRWSVHEWRT